MSSNGSMTKIYLMAVFFRNETGTDFIWRKKSNQVNPSVRTAEVHYRTAKIHPLLADTLSQLEKRFSKHNKGAMKLVLLLPSNCYISTRISEEELKEIYDFYEVHLLPNLFNNLCGEYFLVQ